MNKYLCTFVFVVVGFVAFATNNSKTTIVEGRVVEMVAGKHEPVSMAYVYCDNMLYTTYTNANGEFKLEIPKGKNLVKVSFKGYSATSEDINTKNVKNLSIELERDNSLAEN